MVQKIRTKDLEVSLFDHGLIEIESSKFRNVSVEIDPVDPTDPSTPLGSLYHIKLYTSEKSVKRFPFEFDSVWVMGNGTILKRGDEYSEYMAKHKG